MRRRTRCATSNTGAIVAAGIVASYRGGDDPNTDRVERRKHAGRRGRRLARVSAQDHGNGAAASLSGRYLRLGLQVGRHVDGIVDAYFGPTELAAAVAAEPPVAPSRSSPRRRRYSTRSTTAGCETRSPACAPTRGRSRARTARTPTRSRAATAYGRPTPTKQCSQRRTSGSESCFLPATETSPTGTSAGRLDPRATGADRAHVASAIDEARAQTSRLVECPRRGRRRRDRARRGVAGVLLLPRRLPQPDRGQRRPADVGDRAAPAGHARDVPRSPHRAHRKEQLLVRDRSLLEETIVLVPTPQSLVAEGIAQIGPSILLDGDGGPALAAVLHDAGVELDLAYAPRGRRRIPCRGGARSCRGSRARRTCRRESTPSSTASGRGRARRPSTACPP